MASTGRDTQDLSLGLGNRLADPETTAAVSLDAQLREAVFERLIVQAEEERLGSRGRRSSERR